MIMAVLHMNMLIVIEGLQYDLCHGNHLPFSDNIVVLLLPQLLCEIFIQCICIFGEW